MTTDAAFSAEDIRSRHPCFSESAHFNRGRIHLPVSPGCNIQCRFCKRSFNNTEARPGVSRELLTPEAAVGLVRRGLELCPEISVVGIAGPGDTLATDRAVRTFERVHAEFPHLIKCMSTNGLLLPQKVEEIAGVGVGTLTVTVNAVDPVILDGIVARVVVDGQWLTGQKAMETLIAAQIEGIGRAVDLGMLVKVNTVLVPEVNGHHIEEVARTVAALGASFINVIALIPQHEMADRRAPTTEEWEQACALAEEHLPVFRHCKRCRADACGIPGAGRDFGASLYGGVAPTFSHG